MFHVTLKINFDGRKCNSNQNWNNNKCLWGCKNPIKHLASKTNYVRNPCGCASQSNWYLKSIVDDLVITRDWIIDVEYNVSINLYDEKAT